ncbi:MULTISPECIES: restriction endonuclease subunit S [Pseudomonas]|uniref:restriction endonuclease subunit S n=1 Tax=Pseudomonas TaxID=286 RepID=UPI0013A71EE7|nr:restriction endonuclease subunit S [Pseudomonas sp. OIL-1]QIB51527.1 restriction endonuclease subunit S [Pseudomonas sp. OIL-1]
MTALLTESLPLLAGAPNGIKKLRELILELAVRGKLVPQDPDDEPASHLLKRIFEEKARLVAEGKIKKQKALAEIGKKEKPFVIPPDWEWVRLGSLLKKIGAGSTPLGGKKAYVADGIKFLRSQNVWNEGLRLNDVAFIPEETHQRMSGTHVEAGDLLFNITGASIGRCAAVPSDFDTGNVSQHVTIIRPLSGDTQPFLHVVLVSQLIQQTVMDVQVGVSREGLSIGKLSQFLIPFPPEAEQLRIITKVDELMALCDRLEAQQSDAESAHAQLVQALLGSLTQTSDATGFAANWQRLAEHFHTLFTTEPSIDALKQTLLQLAVMGKLVPQDPNDEPTSELLQRIEEEKARLVVEGKIKKQKSLQAIDEEEKPYALPSNWKWVRFDSISNTRLGKMLDKAKNKGDLRPYLRNTNVQWFNFEIDDLKSMRFEEHELDEYRVIPGDLVICEGGEPGRCAVWQGDIEHMFIQKALHRARPWLDISPFFLQFCLKTAAHTGFLNQFFTGATIKHFSGEKLAKYPVPLPPLAEQHRIVEKVDELTALCDQLKTRLTQARQLNEQLASTLVEQAVA